MTGRDWALAVHLLGVVFLFSGMSVAGVAHAAARRQERPSLIAVLLGMSRAGVLFVVAGSALVLVGGFWLIEESNDFYSLSDGWIAAGLVLLAAAFVLGGIGGQQPKRARLLAEELARTGDSPTPELRKMLDAPLALALNYAAAGAIFAAFILMIWRP
jgi:uncharacterized membrane protein